MFAAAATLQSKGAKAERPHMGSKPECSQRAARVQPEGKARSLTDGAKELTDGAKELTDRDTHHPRSTSGCRAGVTCARTLHRFHVSHFSLLFLSVRLSPEEQPKNQPAITGPASPPTGPLR
ncbi:hypothetical protein VDGL01_05162 [Verticillium dahliae]